MPRSNPVVNGVRTQRCEGCGLHKTCRAVYPLKAVCRGCEALLLGQQAALVNLTRRKPRDTGPRVAAVLEG